MEEKELKFKVGNILKRRNYKLFHYEVVDIMIWKGYQLVEIKPLDLIEPKRTGSYDNFVFVNDPFVNDWEVLK